MATFLNSLEEEWEKGLLQELEADLERFLRKHADEIRDAVQHPGQTMVRLARSPSDKETVSDQRLIDLCVRSLIQKIGCVNAKRDVEEQKKQIHNEIWFEGERIQGPVPPERQEQIAQMWAHLHAAKWREWRLQEILFTWEKKLAQFMRLILEPGTTTRIAKKGNTTRRQRPDGSQAG